MYNMSGGASSAKFRRDRLEASQTNRKKMSENNSVACARPQATAGQNNNNNNKQSIYDDTNHGQNQNSVVGQLTQINIKSDNDLRALGSMSPVSILKLHEQRLNLNATILSQLTKQVEDYHKIKQVPINNTTNTTPTINNASNDVALTSRITELEKKMSQLLQPSSISTPVVVVHEVSKQQFDALSLKCSTMEGQLHTLMTTMHSFNEQRSSNQTKQFRTDEQEKQEKQEKRIDLLQSLIVTQRDLVSDISVIVKTFSNTQKPCSCEQISIKTSDCICSLKCASLLPLMPLMPLMPLSLSDVSDVFPETVSLMEATEVTNINDNINDNINADELVSNESELSDVICEVNDVTNDTSEPSLVLQGESDTINVNLSPHSPHSHQTTFTDTLERQVESKLEVQKITTQPTKTGRKSKRTVNI